MIKTPVRDGKDTSILDANGKQIAFAVFAEMAEIVDALNTAADQSRVIEVMRTALEKLSRLGNGDHLGNSDGNVIAQKALAEAKRIMEGK